MDVAFLVREVATPPSLVLEPFFEEQMVLLRLATSDRNELDPVDLKSLEPEYEFYMNWGTGYQSWHDKLWDPLSPYRVRVDVAGIIPHMMSDDRHWAIVANSVGNYLMQSGKFVIQRLSESPPKRICYKLTHKYPSEATLQSLLILKMYLDTVFGRE
jgi:DNA-binding transcriptional LysR family regulator